MTELRIEPYEISAASLGPENPLPVFRAADVDASVQADSGIPEEDRRYLGWRTGFRVLPYRMQDSYDRNKQPHSFRAAVLENEFLRATVLPDLGSRLVSLFDKMSERELLARNPVFQPVNMALRNAWFGGGIEWNASQPGHHYLTCSPVYAAHVMGTRSEPVLRIYEWDRVKCFPWQVDLHLPPGSPFLFARVRLINPTDHTIPMYWWTNIAVPELAGARTLSPADTVLRNQDSDPLSLMRLPVVDGADVTYATNHEYAQEMFFRIPDGHRRWVAQLDAEGTGLFQASTDRLRGRKMFCWGMSQGGRRWQDYLAEPRFAFAEIQAGIGRTQMECVPMPPNAQWTWTEAFGLLEADPAKVHSKNWGQSWRAAEAALNTVLSQEKLDAFDKDFAQVTSRPPREILSRGSGWGALERSRVAVQKKHDRIPGELVFSDWDLTPYLEPWVDLLDTGVLPERSPDDDPGQTMVQGEWRILLEESIKAERSDHWLAWYQLGNMRLEALDNNGAREAWQQSLARRRSGWALRNLSILEEREGRAEAAIELLREAWEIGPKIAPLALEYAQRLAQAERYEELREFVAQVPEEVGKNERIRILWAKAALQTGHPGELEGFFDTEFATVREGEATLTDLWFEYHERRIASEQGVSVTNEIRKGVRRDFPLPAKIDFRMRAE